MKKTSTLITGTRSPGTCATCRHSNQETVDFREGHLFCWMDRQTKGDAQRCDVIRPLPKSTRDAVEAWTPYYLYEPYDGKNGTYDRTQDLRIVAEDADDDIRRSLRADIPVIE
jgi:hypothetical protein